jgi:hypothetical protein
MNNITKDAYRVVNPDVGLSPHTGMNRQHWIECGKYILGRAFSHVGKFEDLLLFPNVPGSKAYPREGDPEWRYKSWMMEGLRRTMSVAAPLMHAEPEVVLKGYKLRDYYVHHISETVRPGSPSCLPFPEELPDATYQFTCELGGLAMLLLLFEDVVWPYMNAEQQSNLAAMLSKWGHHRTTQNNWRYFNIMMLTFLKKKGYPINEALLNDHLDHIMAFYAGDGWYLEQNYNYYTLYVYHLYPIIWGRVYGDQHDPARVAVFERNFRNFMQYYPYFFGRDGYMNMWARSICYRLAFAGGFPLTFLAEQPATMDPGFARRLCSGTLLQFITREDFWVNEVPSLGFYGHREYLLQEYSCSASPYWMFMPFLSLALPENSPFWTAKENEGFWPSLGDNSKTLLMKSSGIALTVHGVNGTSEIRPAKVNEENHNYNRLCYNTHFPWEEHAPEGGTAMTYAFRSLDPRDLDARDSLFYLGLTSANTESHKKAAEFTTPQTVLSNGMKDDVLYRQILMRQPPNTGTGYTIDLADIVLPGGVLRVDRTRLSFEHQLTLGHFALPHLAGKVADIRTLTVKGYPVVTASIEGRQVAMMILQGWDGLAHKVHSGRNAESEESTVIYAYRERKDPMPSMELMVTLMLHKCDNSEWTEEQLYPFKQLDLKRYMPSGSVWGAEIELLDGKSYTVDFLEKDGLRQC